MVNFFTSSANASLTPDEAHKWARVGALAAFALILSYIETFIPLPVPIPGAKLGLANIPILMALKLMDIRCAFVIALIKTIVTGLIFGSPIMIPYSAAGTFLALAAMWPLVHVRGLHITLISIIGSIFHIVGQLAAATVLLETMLVWYTFPFLLIIACITGAFTGWIASRLIALLDGKVQRKQPSEHSMRDFQLSKPEHKGSMTTISGGISPKTTTTTPLWISIIDTRILLVAFITYLVIVLALNAIAPLAICLILALAAALYTRITARDALKAALPLLSILLITTIAQVLYQQQGNPVATLGPVVLTDRALTTIGIMFIRLICIMLMSIALVRAASFERLSRAILRLLTPLSRLGVRADALALALDVALQFIPLLTEDFKQLQACAKDSDPSFGKGRLQDRLRAYLSLMEPLCVRAFVSADALADTFTIEATRTNETYETYETHRTYEKRTSPQRTPTQRNMPTDTLGTLTTYDIKR